MFFAGRSKLVGLTPKGHTGLLYPSCDVQNRDCPDLSAFLPGACDVGHVLRNHEACTSSRPTCSIPKGPRGSVSGNTYSIRTPRLSIVSTTFQRQKVAPWTSICQMILGAKPSKNRTKLHAAPAYSNCVTNHWATTLESWWNECQDKVPDVLPALARYRVSFRTNSTEIPLTMPATSIGGTRIDKACQHRGRRVDSMCAAYWSTTATVPDLELGRTRESGLGLAPSKWFASRGLLTDQLVVESSATSDHQPKLAVADQ
ncbi:hypothetical protein EDD16DRAFT_1629126 [Pisolithus croceorrhizus]|nr:hypothetical protein EDD16DRAFT_1629126 [Pisolithus croceorrhizus]